jgi:ATP-binding cassette subfamily D (ALD) long-chain fatty acid import protein
MQSLLRDPKSLIPKRGRKSVLVVLVALFLLRARAIPRITRSPPTTYGKRLTQAEIDQALQELYRDNPDGSKTLLVPFRGRISEVPY